MNAIQNLTRGNLIKSLAAKVTGHGYYNPLKSGTALPAFQGYAARVPATVSEPTRRGDWNPGVHGWKSR